MSDKEHPSNPVDDLRRRAEEIARQRTTQTPQALAALSPEAARALLHNLQVHQIELEMQNDELRRTQEALEASRERYFDLYDLAPVGYVTLSEAGLILEANLTVARLLGVARGALPRQPLTRFILREDQDIYYHHRQALFATGAPQECELRLLPKDGDPFWAHLHATAATDADGAPQCRVVMSDISARRQAEEALRESESLYHSLAENIQDYIMRYDRQYRHIYANAAAITATGLPREQYLGKTHREMGFPTELCELWEGAIGRAFATGQPQREVFTWQSARGEMTLDWRAVPEFRADGSIATVLALSRDITALRQGEQALRESEGQYRLLVETMHDGLARLDKDGRFLYANDRFCHLLGYTHDELLGRHHLEIVAPERTPDHQAEMAQRQAGMARTYETQLKHKSGTLIPVMLSGSPVFDLNGNFDGTIGVFTDITERKRDEEALREREGHYRALVEHAGEGIYVAQDGLIKFANAKLEEISGYTRAELDSRSLADLTHSDDREAVMERHFQRLRGVPLPATESRRIIHRSGETRWVEFIATLITWEGRTATLNFINDITARKQAEEELQESKALIEAVVENIPLMLFLKEATDLRFVMFNRAGEELLGYDRKALLGKNNLDLFPPEQAAHFMAKDREVLDGKLSLLDIPEEAILTAKQGQRLLHTRKVCVLGADGNTKYLLGISEDITERKRAEEALRESEANFRNLVESMTDGVVIGAADGRHIYANRRAAELLRYTPEELLQTMQQDLADPAAYPMLRQRLQDRIAGRPLPTTYETIIRRKDGTSFPADITGTRTIWQGQPCDLVLLRDITARKQAEEELRESQALIEAVVDNIPLMLFLKEATDLRFVMFNRAGEELLGYDRKALLGKNNLDLFPPEQAAHFMAKDREVLDGNVGMLDIPEEAILTAKQGQRLLHTRKVCVLGADGNTKYLLGISEDITARKQAEEALRESEETYRALVDGLPDIVMRFDRAFHHLFVSSNVQQVVGMAASQFIGKTHQELGFPAANCAQWESAIGRVFASAKPYETEFSVVGKSGATVFNWRLVPEFDAHGQVQTVLTISRDVTEQRRIATEYRTLFESMLDGFAAHEIIVDENNHPIDYRFLSLNPAFERLTGLNADQVVGKRVLEVMPDTEPYWVETYGRVALTGEPVRFENYSQALGKHFAIYAFRPYPGQFACVFQDVTERKQAEEALRASEERFKTMFDQAPLGITLTDSQTGHYSMVNPTFAKMVGRAIEEITNGDWMSIAHPDDLQKDEEQMALLNAGKIAGFQIEKRYLRPDGTPVWADMTIASMMAKDRVPPQHLCMVADITARKRMEEEQARLQEQLVQAQKMESVGRLAGGVAHDFNNMLQAILGYTAMTLGEVEPHSTAHDNLLEVQKAAQHSADLTRQLLAFARRQIMSPKVLDLNETVSNMLKMLQRLIGEDIRLAFIPGGTLWMVRMDPSQVDQILANLVSNARDAIRGVGKITIETDNVTLDAAYCAEHHEFTPGDYVLLAVSDTGAGMDKETLSHLFEPFFTTKAMGQGTGLGLSMVYGIIRQNDGFINVYSELGQGTTFRVYLPRFSAPATPEVKVAESPMPRGSETILLVEDEAAILNMGRRILTSLGYTVLSAPTPDEAQRLVAAHQGEIHLLITDVVMPEMNGRDLAARLKALKPGLRTLFMSGYTANVIAHHGILEEGVYFIQKPFSVPALAAKVREALGS